MDWFSGRISRASVRQTMEKSAVVERLKEFGETRESSDWNDLDCETEQLVRGNPFAFLLAVAFDRGMPWQRAWRIPVEIDHADRLDPAQLASMDEPDLMELIDGLAVRPRYGARQGARTLSDAARLVCERFGGDASAIWTGASPAEVRRRCRRSMGSEPGSPPWRRASSTTILAVSGDRSGR